MDFNIQNKISNFIENQFPQFYQEDGPTFILFVKAYYEWLEETGNITKESRELLNYRDIDNTLESFLEHFQKKYLYGIPFNVIINKRYLLKHILDIYRSKSSIQCYKLLFKLIYDEEIDIYLPGRDIIKSSHGSWKEPYFLELSISDDIHKLVGKEIIGIHSKTRAIVESFNKEYFDTNIKNILYISNIRPLNSAFDIGEKIVEYGQETNATSIKNAASILGSLYELEIINGGQGFKIGDAIKITNKNIYNNEKLSNGVDGLLRINKVTRVLGAMDFNIISPGFGYTDDSLCLFYPNDENGLGASFGLGSLTFKQNIYYNTDILCDYTNKTLNSTFGFPLNPSGNLSSNINSCLSYSNNFFGSLGTLSKIRTGENYTAAANCFVRSVISSNVLQGNIVYSTTSNTVTGVNTVFTDIFTNNSIMCLQANTMLGVTQEYIMVKSVTNSTSLQLYAAPKFNSTVSTTYKISPVILPSNFALYESIMYTSNNTIIGMNEFISSIPSQLNDVANSAIAINSGKGYINGEIVKAYLYGAISDVITVIDTGINYSNNDALIFAGDAENRATGYITTDSNGSIITATLTLDGSGYLSLPEIRIQSNTGYNGILQISIVEYNQTAEIVGKIIKSGIGKARGYWTTTKGFLNSNKYIQDSYYYQDYSYEIKSAKQLREYKDILQNTFHIAGVELFGNFMLNSKIESNTEILYESTTANTTLLNYILLDNINIKVDITSMTIDAVTL